MLRTNLPRRCITSICALATRKVPRHVIVACAVLAAANVFLSGRPAVASPGCVTTGGDVVCTEQGALRGTTENGMLAFKGIPYAKPPVGSLRWQPPSPPEAWTGVRDASRFGAICPQLSGQNVIGDEDCLTLNVWAPATPSASPLPVMVFLPGGGNHAFSGQGAPVFGGVSYNGGALVPEGVIFVSFNYRLGALGFLAHAALSAERAERVSGNYGNLDQVAMLQWLQRNIAAFGGDPHRIFLFGTSAGGGNICALMTAPSARGLFHGAAMQASVPTGCELPTLADAEQGTGQRVAQALGCTADVAACLRGKSTAEIVRAVPGTFGLFPRIYGPNVDGWLFPEQPRALIERGTYRHMPVIVGNSAQETMLFVNSVGPVTDEASYAAAIERVFGADAAARIVQRYPATAYPSPRQALVQLTTDALFTCQSQRVARSLARAQRQPVYRYLFDHTLENDPELRAQGAVHTVEHVFFFPWQGSYRPTSTDLEIQRLLVGDWAELARAGRLGSAGSRGWPRAAHGDAYFLISADPSPKQGDGGAQCDFWDTVQLPWPHL